MENLSGPWPALVGAAWEYLEMEPGAPCFQLGLLALVMSPRARAKREGMCVCVCAYMHVYLHLNPFASIYLCMCGVVCFGANTKRKWHLFLLSKW